MATEFYLMVAVREGRDRQEMHEAIRKHSVAAAEAIRAERKRTTCLTVLLQILLFMKSMGAFRDNN